MENFATREVLTSAKMNTLVLELNGKQAAISDLDTIRSGANAGATAYQKPLTGIPSTDLADSVQTSLGNISTLQGNVSSAQGDITALQGKVSKLERGTSLTSLTDNTVEGGKKYNIHLTSSANTLTISTIENSTYESIIYLQIDDNANSEISLPATYKSVGIPSFENGKDYVMSILDGIIVCGEISETSQTV